MMWQSGHEYDPINYGKKTLVGLPPPSYTCFRCGKPGHYIKNCPTKGDKNFESGRRIKRSTGIPRSFLMEVKDPNMKGAMLTNGGKYAIPIIDAEAYAIGKKEKPPFLPEEPASSSEEDDPIPEELLCLICKDIMTDAVLIPCCGNSYCDECVRTALLESDEHTCPTCHQNDVSPDALVANKFLRQTVNNFKNKTWHAKRQRKQLPPPPPPIPTPRPLIQQNLQPLMRSPGSRQQDPLVVPVTSSSAHPTPSRSSLTSNPSSLAPSVPGNPSSAPAPVPDIKAKISISVHSEKSDGPFRDSDNKLLPAAALTLEHSKGASSMAITALMEEKCYQEPVLGTPSLLGQSLSHGQLIPTTDPVRINAAHPGGGRPGWEHFNKHEYFNRYREVPPPYDIKAYYGQRIDFRDPFEKECYQEWERKYREWYEKYYKGYTVGEWHRPSASSEDFSPERLLPLNIRNSPFTRGCREDYAAGQSHRIRNLGGNSPEKISTRDSHNPKGNRKSKEKESDNVPGDSKGNKPKKHGKRRKGEESESFLNPDLLETSRKSRESSGIDETKADKMFVLPGRDEPMDAESIAFKSVSEKDKREKDKPKVKSDQTKLKIDGSATAMKDIVIKPSKGPKEKVDRDCEKSLQYEPPLKKVKVEATKINSVKPSSSSQKEGKIPGTSKKPTLNLQKNTRMSRRRR